jgi:hypothetical protein
MHFLPDYYVTGARVSAVSSILLLLLTLSSLVLYVLKDAPRAEKRREEENK